ncbi:MAG: SUMF1/EgtB/PvdO family nonheme iron enzyme [Polyangiaceae bacterium]|nr:SUMF1/EgtB/PvdO family nonheme iron enzyme [Polyangiaceae bacterium]
MVKRSVVLVAFVSALMVVSACKRSAPSTADADRGTAAPASRPTAESDALGAPRTGMAWIPAGVLRAGTPVDRVPRVPDEELPDLPIEMGGFYIDVMPWPNEPGAIPTSSVTRDEAASLCASKGKRLCTELEWERACKADGNATYEYGDAYRAAACGTGVSPEEAARRPIGEHAQCKSGFGVADMHGGAWEWTSSAWARGHKDSSLGVLRGGNAVAGELVGRCANALGRRATSKSPTMGLRCCAGPKNEATVDLALTKPPAFERIGALNELHDAWEPALRSAIGTAANNVTRAWRWAPVANEELFIIVGCKQVGTQTCSMAIGRDGATKSIVASAEVGRMPNMLRLGDVRHLRIRGLDMHGTFGRDITYVYGNVDLANPRRP